MTQINGIVSGLDTASIVSQLRALALRPVQQLEARQAALQSRSSAWDAFSAKAFGFRVLWCNRFGQPAERIPAAPDGEIADLSSLPRIVSQ